MRGKMNGNRIHAMREDKTVGVVVRAEILWL
jgi:hypothetical protein